jgi:group I intron endonuclease
MLNFDCGIYGITSPEGKIYIGQASSFKRRWSVHVSDLRGGKHHSKGLQEAFLKYGEDAIAFTRIAIVPIDQLNMREQEQIDARSPEMLYNIVLSAGNPSRGRNVSEETRAKLREKKALNPQNGRQKKEITKRRISESMRGKTLPPDRLAKKSAAISAANSGEKNAGARAVVCVETGELFPTITFAAQWVGGDRITKTVVGGIIGVCVGRRPTAYGYTWRYADLAA